MLCCSAGAQVSQWLDLAILYMRPNDYRYWSKEKMNYPGEASAQTKSKHPPTYIIVNWENNSVPAHRITSTIP